MEEIGKVVKCEKGIISVRVDRTDACKGCNMCGFKNKDKSVIMKVDNNINAKEGDLVTISISTGFSVFASFIIYIVPLIMAAIGYIIGTAVTKKEIFQFLFLIGFMILGLLIGVLVDKKAKKSKRKPTALSIFKSASDENDNELAESDILEKNDKKDNF